MNLSSTMPLLLLTWSKSLFAIGLVGLRETLQRADAPILGWLEKNTERAHPFCAITPCPSPIVVRLGWFISWLN
jgi:hypothetical protein